MAFYLRANVLASEVFAFHFPSRTRGGWKIDISKIPNSIINN